MTHTDVEAAKEQLATAYTEFKNSVFGAPEHEKKAHRLVVIALAAREKNWSWNALGDVCGISGEGLRQTVIRWAEVASKGPKVKIDFPAYQRPPHTGKTRAGRGRPVREAPVITDAERKRLRELGPQARQNTGARSLDSPIREASENFSALVIELKQRGLTWHQIEEATEGSHKASGLRMRAARHGAQHGGNWSVPPTISAYRGVSIHDPAYLKGLADKARAAAEAASQE